MPQATEADDPDPAAGPDIPGAQRRIGGDAGAQQRRGLGQLQALGHPQDEFFAHHQVLGIAAVGHLVGNAVQAVVGLGIVLAAHLFFALAALVAHLAGVHHAADGDAVADLVPLDLGADGGDPADDLVARDHGVAAGAPVVARLVQVGVADPAIEDFHRHIVGAQGATVEGERRQGNPGGLRCVTEGLHDQRSCVRESE